MAQLDKLVDKLQHNQEIILESNKTPLLKTDAGMKTMLNQQLTSQQLIALLQEIAPAGTKASLMQKKQTRFEYVFNGKSFFVVYTPQGDQVTANITTSEAAGAARPFGGAEPEINVLLRKMFQMGASDLHITSNHRPMIRLHGDLEEVSDQPVAGQDRVQALLGAIMPPHNAAQFEETHDTDFAHEIAGLARFRVNVFMDRFGMGAVFRPIPLELVTAEKLGLSKEILDLCFLTNGLVLVTGPTGSGKSTTLCALVDYINQHRKDHIITIEDPIEFVHQKKNCLINQREVNVHTRSFASALRAALREDPDIVLVGEMRDVETISLAIEAAETGHLVFGALPTTTAASAVERIIDQFPADRQSQIRTMLARSLKGVIAQTLCKKIGGGRVAAMETLFLNSAVSNLIREGKIYQIPSVMQKAKGQGMVLLNEALFNYVVDKVIAPEEAYLRAIDKQGFLAMLKSKGITVNMTGMTG